MKICKKIIVTILLAMMFVTLILPKTFALTAEEQKRKQEIEQKMEQKKEESGSDTDPLGLLKKNSQDSSSSDESGIKKIDTGNINQDSDMNGMISMVFGVVQFICIAAAIIVMIITGVRYMIVAPEQKADIKKQSVVLVVGAVIVFAIATILKIIANLTRTSIN